MRKNQKTFNITPIAVNSARLIFTSESQFTRNVKMDNIMLLKARIKPILDKVSEILLTSKG